MTKMNRPEGASRIIVNRRDKIFANPQKKGDTVARIPIRGESDTRHRERQTVETQARGADSLVNLCPFASGMPTRETGQSKLSLKTTLHICQS
jgi:hypothetical protein